ncbi:MAG: FG-GAP repeat protein [Acidimicrobiales bacterium]|nr:FG-GAP repeat protein [Acidimicrobiales bacterium]
MVFDPEGDPVSLRLLNPLAGMTFLPRVDLRSGSVTPFEWRVPSLSVGHQELLFRAEDGAGSRTLTVSFRVDGCTAPSLMQFGDITGDGRQDVVAIAPSAESSAGAILVWDGALPSGGDPSAKLRGRGSLSLGNVNASQAVQLVDVTGDGVLDVVAGASTTSGGAVYVWSGGPSIQGDINETAKLFVPGAGSGDALGECNLYNSVYRTTDIQVADLDGDGIRDILAGASRADSAGVTDSGAIYIWLGGGAMQGDLPPSATLFVPGASTGDALGSSVGQGVRLEDVTGDGIRDVVALSSHADEGYVWSGATLHPGDNPPTAILDPGPESGTLGGYTSQESLLIADVSGDGVRDVICSSFGADFTPGIGDGAVYIWQGGASLVGSVSPLASLYDDVFGRRIGLIGVDRGVRIADVTNDGVADVVVGCADAWFNGSVGGVYVWAGGPSLVGSPLATALLGDPQGVGGDSLCYEYRGTLQILDVSGDGVLDVVAAAPFADVADIVNVGAVLYWDGSAGFAGFVPPTARLFVSNAQAGDKLGYLEFSTSAVHISDVTGDGNRDIIVGASLADVAGVADSGAVYVWSGTGLLGDVTPDAMLTVPTASPQDQLGVVGASTSGYDMPSGLRLCDVTGDAVADVVAAACCADVSGVRDAGAVYIWNGGGNLLGQVAPSSVVTVP